MNRADAHAFALDLVRRRLAKGWDRASIEDITYEGACGPNTPGYFIAGGRITVPHAFRHDQQDSHTFRLSGLLDEAESPQEGLFRC